MNGKKNSICLNMIVKNESNVITRCLDSVKDLIDYWVISDTGSTDGTQQIIRDYFKQHQIHGELLENEWRDFAHNRNLALEAALGKTDYILFMDADDYLLKDDTFRFQNLTADCYSLKMQRNGLSYYCTKLIRSNLPWSWKGVLHEYLDCPPPYSKDNLPDTCQVQSTTEGARSQNTNKYLDDALVLEKALVLEPDNTRYQFYLAQSYRDAGFHEKALQNYQKRAEMGGWQEEVYCALQEAANQKLLLKMPIMEVVDAYVKAYAYRPQRLEALHQAIKLCRITRCFYLGWQLGWLAKDTPQPIHDSLFVESSVYEWQFLDELSICATYSNKHEEAAIMMETLLHSEQTPPEQKPRLEANLHFARNLA